MSEHPKNSVRLPVNLEELQKRVLLEAELMHIDAQLRNFTPVRDRLVAYGEDANAKYREIESRRDQIRAELKKLRPAALHSRAAELLFRVPPGRSLLSLPITPAAFDLPSGPGFGYSGFVQMGPAHEGLNVIPEGITGSILSSLLRDDGEIYFGGDIVADGAPAPLQSKERFPVHSWTYLIPFPPPTITSVFAYDVKVGVEVSIASATGPSILPTVFWSFVSVGETANFTGQEVVVNTPVGWPVIADVSPYPDYAFQFIGQSRVQRSFLVQDGHVPAIALAVGVGLNIESGAEVMFDAGTSIIIPGANPGGGNIRYGVVDFHYQPYLTLP